MVTRSTQLQLALQHERSVLVYGADVPVAQVMKVGAGGAEPIDARARTLTDTARALRQAVAARLKATPVLVVLLGTHVPDEVRTVIAEVIDGRLNLPGATVPRAARVLAISPTSEPNPLVTDLFASAMPAEDALRSVEVA